MPNPLDDRAVYTFDDLKSWEVKRPGLPPSLAVLGHPVAHSVSPQMHNAALAELAKKYPQLKDWRYFKFDVFPEQLPLTLELLQQKGFRGVNLTVPHKTDSAVLAFADLHTKKLQAVNTLVREGQNWLGSNSDGYGFIQSLHRDLGVNLRDGPEIVIMGVGGAARSVVIACLEEGCGKVWVGNRTPEKLQNFVEQFNRMKPASHLHTLEAFKLAAPPTEKWAKNALVINATSLGLQSGDPSPLNVSLLGPQVKVFDLIYHRQGATALVAAARARKLSAADGLGMLIWQGAKSLTLWIKALEGIEIKPEDITQTMMNAACGELAISPPRNV